MAAGGEDEIPPALKKIDAAMDKLKVFPTSACGKDQKVIDALEKCLSPMQPPA